MDIQSCSWGRTEMQQSLHRGLQLGGELSQPSFYTHLPPLWLCNISPLPKSQRKYKQGERRDRCVVCQRLVGTGGTDRSSQQNDDEP